jgi:hypothetical protein
MKLLIISLSFLFFNIGVLNGQKRLYLSDAEKDSLDLVNFRKQYSTIISYEKASFVGYPSRTLFVKKGNRWSLIYWTRKKLTKSEELFPEHIIPRYKKKKQAIPKAKGDSILAFFIEQQFSKLDSDSLNTYIGPNDSTYTSISHCPTESIYFYHHDKAIEKQAYCLFLYYNTAPNQHKVRFSECVKRLLTVIEEKKTYK